MRTAKALARLRGCAGSPEHSLFAYVISTTISWTGLYVLLNILFCLKYIISTIHHKMCGYIKPWPSGRSGYLEKFILHKYIHVRRKSVIIVTKNPLRKLMTRLDFSAVMGVDNMSFISAT